MTKRTAISLPDDLFREIERARERAARKPIALLIVRPHLKPSGEDH